MKEPVDVSIGCLADATKDEFLLVVPMALGLGLGLRECAEEFCQSALSQGVRLELEETVDWLTRALEAQPADAK